jgi:sugar O-acyltransferase (sialic acid O-acetyltransferase NeuD family)
MSDGKNIFMWGSSSHAGYTSEIVEQQEKYEIKFLYDPTLESDTYQHGYKVFSGSLQELESAVEHSEVQGVIVAIGDNFVRYSIANQIKQNFADLEFVSAIHESAVISNDAEIGKGVVVMAGSVVERYSTVGEGAFLATSCSVGYNNRIGPYASISVKASTGGNCNIGERSVISMGATVIQEIEVGQRSVVGADSLVLNDIPKDVVAYGSPAQVVKNRPRDFKYL